MEQIPTELLINIQKHRQKIQQLKSTVPLPNKGVEYLKETITLKDGTSLEVLIFRPEFSQKLTTYPTLLHIPGTGYNTLYNHFSIVTCSHLAQQSDCQVIVIPHRLAPEYPFPTGQNDAKEIFELLVNDNSSKKFGKNLKIDPEQIVLSGYSSGGTFALHIAQTSKLAKKIKQLILISPVTDFSRPTDRPYKEYDDKDDKVSEHFVNSMFNYYLYRYSSRETTFLCGPNLSPLWNNANLSNFSGIITIICGDKDRFYSDSKRLEEQLTQFKISHTLTVFSNTDHGGFWYNKEIIGFISTTLKDSVSVSSKKKSTQKKQTPVARHSLSRSAHLSQHFSTLPHTRARASATPPPSRVISPVFWQQRSQSYAQLPKPDHQTTPMVSGY